MATTTKTINKNVEIQHIYWNEVYQPIKSDRQLVATCGTSNSGKSTYINRWIKDSDGKDEQGKYLYRTIVRGDDLRRAVTGQVYNKECEPLIHTIKYYMIKSHLITSGQVINDSTNTTPESIRRLLEITTDICFVIFHTPLSVAVERAILNGNHKMKKVIERHYRQLQELLDKGIEKVVEEELNKIEVRWAK